MAVAIVIVSVPFISFGKSLEQVCTDAARHFGINEDEYEMHFTRGKVVTAAGEEVNGNIVFNEEGRAVYTIRVQKSYSRPFTIAVIFHEFAHAAQHKYRLDYQGYNAEQHAELLSFNTMWRSGYWWNAVHLLYMHSWHAKPKDYLVPRELWNIALTGADFG